MIFSCQHSFRNIEKMFQGISDALKTAAEVIAPPPTLCQELEYHWKQVKKFYAEKDNAPPRRHISSTNLPHHLESILQTLITEDNDDTQTIKECMQFLLINRPIDILLQLSISDDPPGMKICLLNWLRRFLSCIKEPPLEHASIHQPVLNFIRICNGKVPSPYEEEEILFLETVAGLIRKNPFLLDIFLTTHQHLASVNSSIKNTKIKKLPTKNSLFQCSKLETNIRRIEIIPDDNVSSTPNTSNHENESNCDIKSSGSFISGADETNLGYSDKANCDCEENDRFQLLDTILTYSESPDSKIVVRACEAALILTSLPTLNMNCPSTIASLEDFTYYLNDKLIYLYEQIPDDMDSDHLEDCSVSWGLIPREPDDNNQFIGKQEIYEFLRWFDYTDSVATECIKVAKLLTKFRTEFLLKCVEPSLIATDTPFVLLLLSKMIKQIRSTKIMDELSNWLIGDALTESYTSTDCLLTIIIDNIQDNPEILIAGLQFIESLLDNPHELILNEMIFRYVNKRGYYDSSNGETIQSWSDEEDERDRRRSSIDEQMKSKTLSPHNILKVINNFLLLLPRQIMSESSGTCYEEYVQDASRHYKIWVKKTLNFVWPREACSPERDDSLAISPIIKRICCSEPCIGGSGNIIDNQCNDSGISEEIFYEGPLLKLLFSHVRNMALQTCDVNLAIIAILSKLAFLPHPYLHEILLNPEIPISAGASTLWNSLKIVARQLLLEIPKYENYQKRIGETGKRLLSPIKNDENDVDTKDEDDEAEQLFEAIVILEEFCKELAAIAFVKYHHATE